MRNTLLKTIVSVGMLLVAMQSFARVELSLQDLRKEVLDENLDIKIQYEKYYQAQKNVSVAFGQFLPSASVNLINVNATLTILQSVVPTPSDWFAYQSSKELKVAEKFTTESIKLNILEGLTINYVNMKYHETMLASLKAQSSLLNEVYEEVKKKEELGVASTGEVFVARRNLLQHNQDIYSLDSLFIAEKQALLIALNRSPNEELVLADLPAENISNIPTTQVQGAELAISNSTEFISNSYQAEGAKYMVSSKRWSFISFNGIGFDYGATLSIEKSKARIIALQGEQLAVKITNQVYAAYETLDLLNQRLELQSQVVAAVSAMSERTAELYMNNALSFTKYYESKSDLFSEERALLKLQMEKAMKVAQLKRLLGLDSSLNNISLEEAQKIELMSVVQTEKKSKFVKISIDADKSIKDQIFSVIYSVENVIKESRKVAGQSTLGLYFKAPTKGDYKVKAKIQMISGQTIVKEALVSVK